MLSAVVAQRDLMAPLEASVQVDNIAKSLIKDEEEREIQDGYAILYKYKEKVSITILGMMDDTVTITEAGYKTKLWMHILWHTQQTKFYSLTPQNVKPWKLHPSDKD